mgnify:CR=1 FL=1
MIDQPAPMVSEASEEGRAATEPLRDDIRLLGGILGDVVREQEGERVFELVEQARKKALAVRRQEVDREGFAELFHETSTRDALHVIRAFSLFALLANLADAGSDLPDALQILLTFPFYEPTIRRIVKGDYVNSDLVLDLTVERLSKSMFASLGVTGPEGVFGRPAGAAARGLNPFIAPLQPGGERVPDSAEPIPANMVPRVSPTTPAAVPAAGGGR